MEEAERRKEGDDNKEDKDKRKRQRSGNRKWRMKIKEGKDKTMISYHRQLIQEATS